MGPFKGFCSDPIQVRETQGVGNKTLDLSSLGGTSSHPAPGRGTSWLQGIGDGRWGFSPLGCLLKSNPGWQYERLVKVSRGPGEGRAPGAWVGTALNSPSSHA